MRLGAIWRYPVKSMAGERVRRATIGVAGVLGDRIVQVYDPGGHVVTARRYPELLRFGATIGAGGEPVVDGLPWTSPAIAARVEAAVVPGARLRRFDGPERFDILPLLIATDGAVALFGRDARRLRPNLLIEGVPGAAERGWPGATLRIGHVLIGLADLRDRCVMTTVDPDTGARDAGVLRDIVRRFGGKLCLNAFVVRPGIVSEGDPVELTTGVRHVDD